MGSINDPHPSMSDLLDVFIIPEVGQFEEGGVSRIGTF
jgi:hypothetical protein